MIKTPRLTERVIEKKPRKPFERKSPEKKKEEAVDQFRETRQDRMLASLSPNLNVMIKAVQKAGRNLMRDFGEIENLQISKKGTGNFVSSADTFCEKTLREYLLEVRPRYGFLQKEGGVIAGADTSHRWVIDPLDGTTNFLHGIGHFAISLALQEDKEITVAVVYNPITSELYYAEKGKGAWAMTSGGNRRLRVSNRAKLEESVIAVGMPHVGYASDCPKFIQQITPLLEKTAGVRSMGCACLNLAYVACGKFEAYFEEKMNSWDIAAGILLVKEAGGHVCTLSGVETVDTILNDGTVLATNDSLYTLFQRTLKTATK